MKNKMIALLIAGSMAVSLMVPTLSYAAEAQKTETEAKAEAETEAEVMAVSSVKVEDGIMTIYIDSDEKDPSLSWQFSREDEENSCIESLTDSTDDGHAYAGSFRAKEGCKETEGTIRLVHTDGVYTDQYMDFTVAIKDGKITESTGGSHAFPTAASELAPLLEGTWAEKNEGLTMLDISLGEKGGLEFVMSDGNGQDGKTSFYTMTARYDAVKEALVYQNGTEHKDVAITDGSEEQTEANEAQGTGAGVFELIPNEDGTAFSEIHWTNSEGGAVTFVRANQ